MRRMRSTTVVLSSGFLGLAASLTACGADEQVLYCGDDRRYVIEETRCHGDEANVYIYHGYWRSDVAAGRQLWDQGVEGRVVATDTAARERLGIPARGGFGGNGAKFSSGG